jgi:S-adenosylmethionine-diacylgycerolhomoserine-N-methlytransferase
MAGHADLMDAVYRRQRHIYDATRKYFLLGRDRLIEELDAQPGAAVVEIGCGTGRNMILAARRWPGARFHGVDISEQMLATAREKVAAAGLSHRIALAQGDATGFDARALFGLDAFDRVFFSYSLSMIPDWRAALAEGARLTAPGGALLGVDFGDQRGQPAWFRKGLRWFLSQYHVAPRDGLGPALEEVAAAAGLEAPAVTPIYAGYAWLMRARRPAASR